MTGRIIPLHGGAHAEIETLLPWFVTGRLDPDDQARVEAHLNDCAECRQALDLERRLRAALVDAPFEADAAFARLRGRLEPARAARRRPPPHWVGWAIAAQILLLAALTVVLFQAPGGSRYHALGAAPTAAAGNLIVMVRPGASEAAFSAALRASGVRLVDGPTAAGAYVLRAPPGQSRSALISLRQHSAIGLAQPIDAGAPP